MEQGPPKPYINVDFFEDLTGRITETAKEDAKLTGFEVDLLDRIEKDEVQPQLGTVIKLSKALDSAFGRIVSGVGNKIYSITRINERKVISRSTSHKGQRKAYTYMSLAPEVKGRHMEALLVQLEEDPEEEISVHEGEEFIFALDGVVKMKIGQDAFELEPGDSVYYLSTTPHHISAKCFTKVEPVGPVGSACPAVAGLSPLSPLARPVPPWRD
jgi:quercetin dioxygenase-like cupin family protein